MTKAILAAIAVLGMSATAFADRGGRYAHGGFHSGYHGYSGHADTALEYTRRMLELPSAPATAHYFAALIHWSLGDAQKAYDETALARRAGFPLDLLRNDPDLADLGERDATRWEAVLSTAPDKPAAP